MLTRGRISEQAGASPKGGTWSSASVAFGKPSFLAISLPNSIWEREKTMPSLEAMASMLYFKRERKATPQASRGERRI